MQDGAGKFAQISGFCGIVLIVSVYVDCSSISGIPSPTVVPVDIFFAVLGLLLTLKYSSSEALNLFNYYCDVLKIVPIYTLTFLVGGLAFSRMAGTSDESGVLIKTYDGYYWTNVLETATLSRMWFTYRNFNTTAGFRPTLTPLPAPLWYMQVHLFLALIFPFVRCAIHKLVRYWWFSPVITQCFLALAYVSIRIALLWHYFRTRPTDNEVLYLYGLFWFSKGFPPLQVLIFIAGCMIPFIGQKNLLMGSTCLYMYATLTAVSSALLYTVDEETYLLFTIAAEMVASCLALLVLQAIWNGKIGDIRLSNVFSAAVFQYVWDCRVYIFFIGYCVAEYMAYLCGLAWGSQMNLILMVIYTPLVIATAILIGNITSATLKMLVRGTRAAAKTQRQIDLSRRLFALSFLLTTFTFIRYAHHRIVVNLDTIGVTYIPQIAAAWARIVLAAESVYFLYILLTLAIHVPFMFYNEPKEKESRQSPMQPFDVLVTCYKERASEIYLTLTKAKESGARRIYLLDDAGRVELQTFCSTHDIVYEARTRKVCRETKANNLNSFFLKYLKEMADRFIILDADMTITDPGCVSQMSSLLDSDKSLAFIQCPQRYYDLHGRDPLCMSSLPFYDVHLKAASLMRACPCVGTNVMFRTAAVKAVGLFPTESITEDYNMSMRMHARGWSSLYLHRDLAFGTSPRTITGWINQRYRWAQGTISFLLFSNPLFKKGLSVYQRIYYTHAILSYIAQPLFLLTVAELASAVYFYTGLDYNVGMLTPSSGSDVMILYLAPVLFSSVVYVLLLYMHVARKNVKSLCVYVIQSISVEILLIPVYLKAISILFRPEAEFKNTNAVPDQPQQPSAKRSFQLTAANFAVGWWAWVTFNCCIFTFHLLTTTSFDDIENKLFLGVVYLYLIWIHVDILRIFLGPPGINLVTAPRHAPISADGEVPTESPFLWSGRWSKINAAFLMCVMAYTITSLSSWRSQNTCTYRKMNIPAKRQQATCDFISYHFSTPTIDELVPAIEEWTGYNTKHVSVFVSFTNDDPKCVVDNVMIPIAQSGRIPYITLMPTRPIPKFQLFYSTPDIYSEDIDALVHRWRRELSRVTSPIRLRFGHEFDGYWYDYAGRFNTVDEIAPIRRLAAFRGVFSQVYDVLSTLRNVEWDLAPTDTIGLVSVYTAVDFELNVTLAPTLIRTNVTNLTYFPGEIEMTVNIHEVLADHFKTKHRTGISELGLGSLNQTFRTSLYDSALQVLSSKNLAFVNIFNIDKEEQGEMRHFSLFNVSRTYKSEDFMADHEVFLSPTTNKSYPVLKGLRSRIRSLCSSTSK